MKNTIRSLVIIMSVMWMGSILKTLIPLPIPDMIYAMILLFASLLLKIVRPESIEGTANCLLSMFAFFFIPAGVGLMNSYGIIEHEVFRVILALTVSFVLTVLSVAYTVRFTARMIKRSQNAEHR